MHYPSAKPLIFLLFTPWVLACILNTVPVLSYLIAWSGSFLIFYLTLASPLRVLPSDLSPGRQVMRPIILIQLIFAGFMCATSIFYFADHIQNNLTGSIFFFDDKTDLIARCQRLSLLGHASLCSGMILVMAIKPEIPLQVNIPISHVLYLLCIVPLVLATVFGYVPQIIQFRHPLLMLSLCSTASLLISGITSRNILQIMTGATIYLWNLFQALFSGYKENLLVGLLLLAFIAYPHYRRIVIFLALPGLLLFCLTMPTLTTIIRKYNWTNQKDRLEAGRSGIEQLTDDQRSAQTEEDSRDFFINRLSEIGMFTQYVSTVPDHMPYYGTDILENAIKAIVPKAVWPEKPDSESLAMERVYQAGVVNRSSLVSAKTRPIADAYLSGGPSVVALFFLVYGLIAQRLSDFAERNFGGYTIGCTIVFNGLFQCLWRGNTLEFMLNNIVYSFLLLLFILWVFKHFRLIQRNQPNRLQ